MRIIHKTYINKDLQSVFNQFDEHLFVKLKPWGVGFKLLRFDGTALGDRVAVELNFGLFKQVWNSQITDFFETEDEICFVDQAFGKDLPFFLKSWKHQHRFIRHGKGTQLIDEIEFQSPYGLSFLMYPALWLQFALRKPIYKKELGNLLKTERQ